MIRNALFLCVVCALVFVFYLPSYVKMQDLHEKNRVYEKRIKDLEQDNVRLEEERRRLTDDPVYFEKVAREKMGIIRDGEVIYKIVGPGQKKDGVNSAEASVIIKPPEKEKVADDKAVPAESPKPVVKAATKSATKAKTIGTKAATKKDCKPGAHNCSSTTVKKNSKVSTSKKTIDSTKE
ncbi:MAG: septum formation initiator family protein [Candidatus Omnitrophica bacterium]|nr:septum formation initiator family protein [Candidatus Omnitrophota bacterium]